MLTDHTLTGFTGWLKIKGAILCVIT